MDVVSDPATRPFIGYFEVSDDLFAWREPRPQQIERRRAALGDLLVFDILLSSGGIANSDTLYPPTDVTSLKRLLDAIELSQYDALKKECLVYFLLKWHQDGREERFQVERCIPPQFTALADAYWHLDAGINISRAVSILSDARLNRDYASKILQAISLAPDSTPLILKYVRTAKPLLTEPDDIDLYAIALAELNLLEAWKFQRTFNETDGTRSRLFKKIVEWCISPNPRPGPLSQLLGLPLTPYEQSLLHSYALEPPATLSSSLLAVLQDFICVRLIQSGKYADAIKIDCQFTSSTAHAKTVPQMQDRTKMVQDLYAALPLAERTLLDSELNFPNQGKPTPTSNNTLPKANGNRNDSDVSMSQSWEDIGAPHTHTQSAVNGGGDVTSSINTPFPEMQAPVVPIPERSRAPRFGGPISSKPILNTGKDPKSAPLLPMSGNGNVNGAIHIMEPRKSLLPLSAVPLSTSTNPLNVSSSSRPRLSLGNNLNQFTLASTSGLKFPPTQPFSSSVSLPASVSVSGLVNGFESAGRKQNAFYQPPPAKVNGVRKAFGSGEESALPSGSGREKPERTDPVGYVTDVEMDDEDEGEEDKRNVEPGAELGFSVFGNGFASRVPDDVRPPPVPTVNTGTRVAPVAARVQERESKKVPPGGFALDDEDASENEQDPAPSPPLRSRHTRMTTTTKTTGGTIRKGRHSKEQDLGRSLPGSLMDEEEEEEEEDHVAPLRAPSPPRRPLRKPRTPTSADLADEGDGVMTRRRSSRLSTTGSVSALSPEPPSPKRTASKPRKSTKATGTRKKRS